MLNIRKGIRRYEKHGISIAPATKSDPHPSIVPQYAHVIEFALVRLRYRYGASIDEILLDPSLGEQFEQMALELAPDLSNRDLRLGALYIRKTRHFEKKDVASIEGLDLEIVEKEWSRPVSLAAVDPANMPSSPGLLELKEEGRYLYISRNNDIRPAADQMRSGSAFDLVANGFWTPRLDKITLQFVAGAAVGDINIGVWEKRLIRDREPIFNWPIPSTRHNELRRSTLASWSYRKGINLSPFRVSLSKSGIGYSLGGRGFRTGVNSRGRSYNSFSIPGTGLPLRRGWGFAT